MARVAWYGAGALLGGVLALAACAAAILLPLRVCLWLLGGLFSAVSCRCCFPAAGARCRFFAAWLPPCFWRRGCGSAPPVPIRWRHWPAGRIPLCGR